MIKYISITIFFAITFVSCRAQFPTDSLCISAINKEYFVGDSVSVCYTNNSKSIMFVKVSLETMTETGEWAEILNDVYEKYRLEKSLIDNSVEIIKDSKSTSVQSMTGITGTRTDYWIINNELFGNDDIRTFRLKYVITTTPLGVRPVKTEIPYYVTTRYSEKFRILSNKY